MKKRITASIGLILAAVMMITAVPVSAFGATDLSDVEVSITEQGGLSYGEDVAADAVIMDEDIMDLTEDPEEALPDDSGTDGIPAEELLTDIGELPSDEQSLDTADGTDVIPVDQDETISADSIGSEAETPEGYIFPDETKFTITFAIEYNGEVKELSYENNLNAGDSQYLTTYFPAEVVSRIRTLAEYGFTDIAPNDYAISGWRVNYDGRDYANSLIRTDLSAVIKTDFTGASYVDLPRKIIGGHDYYYKARLVRRSAFNIYVQAVPEVYFDGRSHVSVEQEIKPGALKSTINDLDLKVYYCEANTWDSEDNYELRFNKDYKVTYKNNKAASMKLESDGAGGYKYVSLDLPDNKRPCALITGINEYAGFSTTVYFDIKPYNLGLNDIVASISGLKHIYAFKDNRISESVKPKVTITIEGRTITLKAGKDYEPVIYKYDADNTKWERTTYKSVQEIKYTGDYLYTADGRGDYCGTAFGEDSGAIFADGTKTGFSINPKVCAYKDKDYKPCQFRVTDSRKYDLANAKISIGRSSVPYRKKLAEGEYHASDFKIRVRDAEGTELNSTAYKLVFDGDDYEYVWGRTDGGAYIVDTSPAEYDDTVGIFVANKYAIRIEAVGGQYFGSQTTKNKVTIKGVTPGFKGIKFTGSSSIKYDGTYDILDADKYEYMTNCPVKPVQPADYLSSYSTSYSGYVKYDYEKALPYLADNTEFVSTVISKEPGTYDRVATAFGPGTDHSRQVKGKYKRTAITMKEAVAGGLLKVTFPETSYMNAGGSMPSVIRIVMGKGTYEKSYIISPNNPGGSDTWLGGFNYNGQSFTITDNGNPANNDQSTVTVSLSASKNKGVGQGVLTIKGDGKLFKGSDTFSYDIKPVTVPATIRVLTTTDKIKVSSPSDTIGTVYAVAKSVKKTGGEPSTKNITLYQSYYKNSNDAQSGLATLAKIDAGRYKITMAPYSSSSNVYTVSVGIPDGKTRDDTGYDFATYGTKLSENYGVFDQAVKIAKIEIKDQDDGDKIYTLPADKPVADYTGKQITRYKVTRVLLNDGTEIPGFCYKVEYGPNVKAGKKGGLIRITLIPDTSTGTEFHVGGSAVFNFEIKNKDVSKY